MNQRQKLVQQEFLNNEKAVIKRLNGVYTQALTDVTGNIKNLEFKIGELQQKYDWMDVDDPERAKVKSMIQSKIYQKQYQEQIRQQVEGVLDRMQTSQFATVSEYLDECYTDGFVGSVFDLHGQNVPLMMPIDQQAMVRAVQLDSKISKGLYTRLGEDVDLLKKKITAQVSRSIATGMTYAQTAKQLANYTRVGYNNAIRIARTEGHRIQTTATMDVMEAAKEKGADIVKQWDATLDDSTRESHVAVDGEIRELDQPFSNGLMFPGDPAGSAAEVINCRCALLQRARWALKEGVNPDTGEVIYSEGAFSKFDSGSDTIQDFSDTDDYKEFKKKYLKAVAEPAPISTPTIAKAKFIPDYDCAIAKGFGTAHYDAMHQLVVDSTDDKAASVWKKYEADIQVGNAHYKGGAHATSGSVYLDIDKVAAGDRISTPYQTAFHEGGHAIDSVARSKISGGHWAARHYSAAYKDGLFPQTIKDEVQELVKAAGEEIKKEFAAHAGDVDWFRANGYMYSWQSTIPKYSKSMAYDAVKKQVKASGSMLAWGDLSDILEGATGAKIQCGVGHGAKYWKDRTYDGVADGLATEAFAEMMDSTFANPESLTLIKQYLPKSHAIFEEMLDSLL